MTIQGTAWLLTIGGIFLLSVLFAVTALRNQKSPNAEALVNRSYRIRTWAFWIIVAGVTPVMLYTLTLLPYGAAAHDDGNVQTVEVTGRMWQWDIDPGKVEADRPVRFRVTSEDVNHGFAIYDAEQTLLAQTQAMPGYTNTLEYTFEEPGTYRVLCMEYCGIAHHKMETTITVTE